MQKILSSVKKILNQTFWKVANFESYIAYKVAIDF